MSRLSQLPVMWRRLNHSQALPLARVIILSDSTNITLSPAAAGQVRFYSTSAPGTPTENSLKPQGSSLEVTVPSRGTGERLTAKPAIKVHLFSEKYDLVVIGSGPSGQRCAIASARRGKKVALVDRFPWHGGVSVHTGTVPSKTLREAILHLTAYRHRGFEYDKIPERVTAKDILHRVRRVQRREMDVIRDQLNRAGVRLISGLARFLDPHHLAVAVDTIGDDVHSRGLTAMSESLNSDVLSSHEEVISADKVLIACGSRPVHPEDVVLDGRHIFDSDQILRTEWEIPRSLLVVGGGVIGLEYASMINAIQGCRATVIDTRSEIIEFLDREILDSLKHEMRHEGGRFLLGETVSSVEVKFDDKRGATMVFANLSSGKQLVGDALLYAMGRQGNTDYLEPQNAGVQVDPKGMVLVNEDYQSAQPHIYAAGDCIGPPALGSTAKHQGHQIADHMWDAKPTRPLMNVPYSVYAIPEISMVGMTEQQLTKEKVRYEAGIAKYEELTRGQMLGGTFGFLKILFCPDTLKILGVHCIGESATEIIHIGQLAMTTGVTLDYFRNNVFNTPTLAEAYRLAAINGFAKLM
eukprot:TRINITY_DN2561_c0_g1::TRINITY_DN2561_c0_g1_i1::g.19427::m.19427 TRINITY_DN2561_c0_g1::TRINITY_DN2561_c0_g1_i1::g.19427  ORF type:complete len:595 (-),score=93.39,sp/P9WHH5/STHA_MYCTU/42.45/5e-126,Pyr_redox_2/PF07992.9/3.4e-31,Pyr_redox_dim/PF02852.17/2.5e+03,Pyr_redox_dim/PF02852.17/5.6e-28,Pyr_redox/PF00070.22/0.026,Pyr_redox/PF00070.22/4.6e-13,FAD_oxidored/PF12831.2/6.3e-10,FAD_oxidored/PF12831.2/7.5e+02,FAD_oxidored/PF12831.2/2e+03,FAD_binding_2/PF00890.19/1e-05,FAD_binding_2/PF00890.19/1.4e+